MKQITSTQNTFIKQLVQLKDKSRERKKTGLFVIEGQRELQLAMEGGYHIETILICSELSNINDSNDLLAKGSFEIMEISKEVYQKLAHRETTEGIIAVAKAKPHNLHALNLNENPLILVAEAPEKPGNIGALLRTADAANLEAVIIANPKTDLYNPNIIRSSVGCCFTRQIAMGTTEEIIAFLKSRDIPIYCAALQASIPYHSCDFKKSTAIVVGTEATGLSEEWLKNSTQNIIIPMQGKIDSMNVSVAAGILIFEAVRQRNYPNF